MNQAEILVKEINRKLTAIKQSESQYLSTDYMKSINSDIAELKEYCNYRGLDFDKLRAKIIR